MTDEDKSREELISELASLRRQVARLEANPIPTKREAYFATLVEAQGLLLIPDEHTLPYEDVLYLLARVTTSCRAYLFESRPNSSRCILRAEWCAPELAVFPTDPGWRNFDLYQQLPRWAEVFSQGDFVFGAVANFPLSERQFLQQQGIVSVLAQPLAVMGEFVGFVGLADCWQERIWSPAEVSLLQAIATAISLALLTQQRTRAWQESHQRFATVLDNMEAIVYVADLETYELLFVNKYARRFFGDITGQTCWEALEPGRSGPCDFCAKRELLIANPDGVYTWEAETPDDRWYYQQNQAIRWIDGRLARLAISTDITDRKRAEKALQQAKEAAEAASRAKSEFLTNMSHELRTPLNAILGYAQILLADSRLDDSHHKNVSIIKRSGEHLLTLINDILDLSKIEAGHMELQPAVFSLRPFLQNIVDMFQLRARQKKIAFHYQPVEPLPDYVQADEKRLRQILINLVGNAVKFTNRGEVVFTARRIEDSGLIRFQIQDTGIGIPPEKLAEIFRPFQQVGQLDASTEGTGLGLTISQHLTQLMGSSLYVESEVSRGSRFWFDIELAAATAEGAISGPAISSDRNLAGPPIPEIEPPPPTEIVALHRLVMIGDIEGLRLRLAEVEEQFRPFKRELDRLARNYELKKLDQFIDQYIE